MGERRGAVGNIMFNDIYKGKKILVTGHGGFCGSWLCFWLRRLGAQVIGYGHHPRTSPNHHTLLGGEIITPGRGELLDFIQLQDAMKAAAPDLIIHTAAKAIVSRTFHEPRETFENNIMSTVNILEASRQCPSIKGIIISVTDKIYEDKNWMYGYRECDEMGGVAPYDASKCCVEHVIRCYREGFGLNIAAARPGNVIGGGDWSEARLFPDIARATSKGEKIQVHTPTSTRPWQFVLEPLAGYLILGQAMFEGRNVNGAYNFSPDGEPMTVLNLLKTAKIYWPKIEWVVDNKPTHPRMVYLLKLDNSKAKEELGWRPAYDMKTAVKNTILWYRDFYTHGFINTEADIIDYQFRMAEAKR